jgi:hypothetical protein
MKELDENNINNTEVILDSNLKVKLKDLLPYYDLWQKFK